MMIFLRKVWEYKSLPPMWMWKPAWFRRLAMVPYVPVTLAWSLVVGPVLVFIVAALVAGLEELQRLNWKMVWRWCRDTWKGQRFRPYDP